jgi:hypothetical protein
LLLSFYSSSFDKDIFGSPKGMITEALTCSEQEMDAFVSWLYSGRLDRKPNQRLPCLLWTFGKKFGTPLFQNNAMQLLSDNIRLGALSVSTAHFAYNNNAADSNPRLFIAEYITHANPLSSGLTESWTPERRQVYRTEWVNLIANGEDLMRDVAELGSYNDNQKQAPWRPSNFPKFLETEPDRSPASWKIGRISKTSERQGATEKQNHYRGSEGREAHE